jgi:hypothetical protein
VAQTVRGLSLESVVLLKAGVLQIIECPNDAVFALARIRAAGICGVFRDRKQAQDYIDRIPSLDRERIRPAGSSLTSTGLESSR